MTISGFRSRIAKRPLTWSLAILLTATPALGVCATMPMPMPAAAAGMGGAAAGRQQNMPLPPCCINPNIAAHAIAIPASEATLHPFAQTAGHGVIAGSAFVTPTVKTNRSLRPPIRAPVAPRRPLYLLNRALLN